MTLKDVIAKLEEIKEREETSCLGDLLLGYGNLENDKYDFKQVELVGGEGEGDHYHIVTKATDKNTKESLLFKLNGYIIILGKVLIFTVMNLMKFLKR